MYLCLLDILTTDPLFVLMQSAILYLPMQDFLGKSDPYLEFARQNPDGSYTVVHKIPVRMTEPHTYMYTRKSVD